MVSVSLSVGLRENVRKESEDVYRRLYFRRKESQDVTNKNESNPLPSKTTKREHCIYTYQAKRKKCDLSHF